MILDNRRMAMIEDAQVRNYQPTFVINQYGIMQYVDAPLLAGLAGADPAFADLAPADLARSATPNAEPGLTSPSK